LDLLWILFDFDLFLWEITHAWSLFAMFANMGDKVPSTV
jgi:hypothetical protein